MPALAERFRLILPDNRGCGQTRSSGAFAARTCAADAAALLDRLGVGKAHVAGISFGGQIAQELAMDHSDVVVSLTLISTSVRSSVRLKEVVETSARMALSAPPELCCRAFLPWVFTEEFFETPGALEAALARMMGNPHPPSPEGLAAQSAAIAAFDAADRVGAVRCPTLVTCGAQDVLTPPEHSRDLAGRIRGAKLAVLDPGAHDLVHEFPDRIAEELVSFLSLTTR